MAAVAVDTPLLTALESLGTVDPVMLGDALLGERAAELLRARDMVESLLAHTVAEARERGLGLGGYLGNWVQGQACARLGRAARNRLLVRADVVAGLPLVAGLHAGGEVSTAFLDAAGVGLRTLPAEAVPTWDAMLAGDARDLDPAEIPRLLAQLRTMIEPEQVNEDAQADTRRSTLHVSPYGSDGAWAINGTLYGLEGELFSRMLGHYGRPRSSDDHRSLAERNAAALVQILRVAERSSADPEFIGAPRGAAGHVIVHCTTETWHDHPGAPAASTEGGTVLDPGQSRPSAAPPSPRPCSTPPPTPTGPPPVPRVPPAPRVLRVPSRRRSVTPVSCAWRWRG